MLADTQIAPSYIPEAELSAVSVPIGDLGSHPICQGIAAVSQSIDRFVGAYFLHTIDRSASERHARAVVPVQSTSVGLFSSRVTTHPFNATLDDISRGQYVRNEMVLSGLKPELVNAYVMSIVAACQQYNYTVKNIADIVPGDESPQKLDPHFELSIRVFNEALKDLVRLESATTIAANALQLQGRALEIREGVEGIVSKLCQTANYFLVLGNLGGWEYEDIKPILEKAGFLVQSEYSYYGSPLFKKAKRPVLPAHT